MSESTNAHTAEHTDTFVFGGFDGPNTTQVPDAFFDVVAPELTEAELRVALYIIRRTFGFKKDTDDISLRQMVCGITTKDGRVLDRGTGLKKSAVANALNGLERKGVIVSRRNRSAERGNEPTTYALNLRRHPLSVPVDKGLSVHVDKPLSVPVDTQYTGRQETVRQQTDRNSNHFDDIASMRQKREHSVFSKETRTFADSRAAGFSTGSSPSPATGGQTGGAVLNGAARNGVATVGEILERRVRRSDVVTSAAIPTGAVADAPQAPETAPETGDPPATRPKRRRAASGGSRGAKRGSGTPSGSTARGRPPKLSPYLEDLIDRYSRELHDDDHQPQNRGQAARLWKTSGRSEESFGQALIEAKAITLEHDVKKRAKVGGEWGARNKMPYYFVVLRDLLGMKDRDEPGRDGAR